MWLLVEVIVEDGYEGTKVTEVTPDYMNFIWPAIEELQRNDGYLDSELCNFLDKVLPKPGNGDLYRVVEIKLFQTDPVSFI